jgi:hypothetical protein
VALSTNEGITTANDIKIVSNILEKVIESNQFTTIETSENVISSVSELLSTDSVVVIKSEVLFNTSTKLRKTLNTLAIQTKISNDSDSLVISRPNVALGILKINGSQNVDISCPQSKNTTSIAFDNKAKDIQSKRKSFASIHLPKSVFERVPNRSKINRLHSFCYRNGLLFTDQNTSEQVMRLLLSALKTVIQMQIALKSLKRLPSAYAKEVGMEMVPLVLT